jgi:hypothetical protein
MRRVHTTIIGFQQIASTPIEEYENVTKILSKEIGTLKSACNYSITGI